MTKRYMSLQKLLQWLTAIHCRRLVKNIGWANQNIGGQKVVKKW